MPPAKDDELDQGSLKNFMPYGTGPSDRLEDSVVGRLIVHQVPARCCAAYYVASFSYRSST